MPYLWIAAGAAVGGVLRYAIATAVSQRLGTSFPFGTMLVNLTGCFCIGLILTLLQRSAAGPHWGFLLVTGLLGGYTTFSSFGWETYILVRDGLLARALAYSVGSVVLGLLGVWLGASFGGRA